MLFSLLFIFSGAIILTMILTVSIAAVTIIGMFASVLIKPYVKIKNISLGIYWVICLVGALAILLTGCISIESAINGITAETSVNPLKILTLFLSMTLLSVYLGDAGFFDYVADALFRKTKGSQLKLFLALYFVVAVLTVFTSNDVIILTFTPPICIFAKKAKISPLPYLVGEFIAANTWSMMLIVGNPTNVYLAQSAGISFFEYFSVMYLPTICGGIVSLVVLLLIFRKDLKTPIQNSLPQKSIASPHGNVKLEKPTMIAAIIHLSACIILLAISDFIGAEMWLICFTLAASLTVFDTFYDALHYHSLSPLVKSVKKEPFELIPFVISMFIIVLSLKECGFTDLLGNLLLRGDKTDGVSFGLISAAASNLLNNIPMSVLFERIISGTSRAAVFGAIIGSNIGAYLTPVGALAGIMWNKILSARGVKLPFIKFVEYGFLVAIPTIIASTLALLLTV